MMKRCISEQKKYEQTTETAVMQWIFYADIIPWLHIMRNLEFHDFQFDYKKGKIFFVTFNVLHGICFAIMSKYLVISFSRKGKKHLIDNPDFIYLTAIDISLLHDITFKAEYYPYLNRITKITWIYLYLRYNITALLNETGTNERKTKFIQIERNGQIMHFTCS